MSQVEDGRHLWFREPPSHGLEVAFLCEQVLFSGRSRYQQVDVVVTRAYGKMLFLDGISQSAAADEFVYHEMLVHPALFGHPRPRSVLLIGGAEGACLREIFRHPDIARVVMVDIDGELIEICKEHLPEWHQGSYDDPRLHLVIGDGRKYLEETREDFDVIIVDLSDPLEDSPAVYLFTREFYHLLWARLKDTGVCTIQAEGIGPTEVALHARIVNTLLSVFPVVRPYPYALPSFHRPDAHVLVAKERSWSAEEMIRRVEEARMDLQFFSAEMARGLFCLPPYVYRAYETYSDILTDDDPGLAPLS